MQNTDLLDLIKKINIQIRSQYGWKLFKIFQLTCYDNCVMSMGDVIYHPVRDKTTDTKTIILSRLQDNIDLIRGKELDNFFDTMLSC